MIYQLLFVLIPLIYFYYYYRRFPEESSGNKFEDFFSFFGFKRINLDTLKKGVTLAFFLIVVYLIVAYVYGYFTYDTGDSVGNFIKESYSSLGWVFIAIVLANSFIEEFFFRSFLIDRFGIFWSTLAFALMHISYGSLFEIIGAFALGLVLAFYWKKDRDVYVLFFGHAIYNLFIIFIALV